MRIILACLALSALSPLAACSSSDTTPAPIPDGNWDVTLAFDGGGDCDTSGLPPTYDINFDIATAADGYTISAEQGLDGGNTGGAIVCTSTICELSFTDSGPGSEFSNICTQTISATLDEDGNDAVTGNGQIDFLLDDGSSCTATFNASGDVAH
ncbi:MAG TPA: hypothetical protein VGF94_04425 [Kofleriaceae bacterium]|jgi:hypothetical protein